MRAVYLTGKLVYLRALTKDDAKQSASWFPEPFPIDPGRAASYLKETHSNLWDRRRRLVIAKLTDDSIAGSVELASNRTHARVSFTLSPVDVDGDELQADAIGVIVHWLRDEAEHITVEITIASDQPRSIAAAEELGLVAGARFREHICRGGHRVDRLMYQALNPYLLKQEGLDA